ncbi:dTMP kinase [Acetobacter sp. AN02]|uniref:dTMP kinase n=1 Tax=Acetobacter sp. AN02 TaxID=2894186 RepID=UPI0024344671|nr:dTMP kinase [Acetobacter sp. AN02]MDG6093772.1 dTMP kinase [Acetobacter sp. AN02]
MTRRHGLFVTLEGGEGVGKSTQLPLIADALRDQGHEVVTTREPGGSPGAEALRQLLLFGEAELSVRAEVMAHFAARTDHVDRVIRPALEAGKIVLCDRFSDSTMAYQGYGRAAGNPELVGLIARLTELVAIRPDLTLLFTADPAITQERLTARAARADRYEQADHMFHQRVRDGFRTIAASDPDRFHEICTDDRDIPAVTKAATAVVNARLKKAA